MKEIEEILLGGMFRPTEQNCPTREGELIGSLDKIHDIPNPRVGMRVYVENTGKEYIIKSLKDKTIGGVNVPNAAVDRFEEAADLEVVNEMITPLIEDFATESGNRLNADNYIKANALQYNKIGFSVFTDRVQLYAKNISDNDVRVDDIPAATPERAGVMSAEDKRKLDAAGATKILWDASSNMNDFKTPGVYDIYGERTKQDDNIPILNANPGHSFSARLTVIASTLQPANNEICVTQFLMLSNRRGGDGNMYVRTYNENNSPFKNWWTPWQKLQGIREGYIFTDEVQVNPDGGIQQLVGETGLYNMVDNGIYSGIYTDDPTFQSPSFIETFTLIVINNYAVVGQSNGQLKQTISQLKYAVDAITNQATVKQRTKTDGGDWTEWEDIAGGGSSEVDITDAVKAYGLPTLIEQGFAKEGVTYVAHILNKDLSDKKIVFDKQGKLADFFQAKYVVSPAGATIKFNYSLLKGDEGYNSDYRVVSGILLLDGGKYEFYISIDLNRAFVSADMTTL